MANKQEQITFYKYITQVSSQVSCCSLYSTPPTVAELLQTQVAQRKKQKAKEHVFHTGGTCEDYILTYIMGRKMYKTRFYKKFNITLVCVCDVLVCCGLNDIHYSDVQFSTGLAGARSCG